MIDLHTHTFLSDGELVVSELVRRAEMAGVRVINVSDHVDRSNIDLVVPRMVKAAAELDRLCPLTVIAGAEITHCPLGQIAVLVREARTLGAQLVTVHGETLSEPVIPGTNRAGIEAGADIIAHPGLITRDDAALAARRDVCLEISARKGHSLANGHVATLARATGAKLVFGTDSHDVEDLCSMEQAERILAGASLDAAEIRRVWENAEVLVKKALSRRCQDMKGDAT